MPDSQAIAFFTRAHYDYHSKIYQKDVARAAVALRDEVIEAAKEGGFEAERKPGAANPRLTFSRDALGVFLCVDEDDPRGFYLLTDHIVETPIEYDPCSKTFVGVEVEPTATEPKKRRSAASATAEAVVNLLRAQRPPPKR